MPSRPPGTAPLHLLLDGERADHSRGAVPGDAGHTLASQDPKYADFLLKSDGGPKSGKVKLAPGNYTIYCTVPGHEGLGMKATRTVS